MFLENTYADVLIIKDCVSISNDVNFRKYFRNLNFVNLENKKKNVFIFNIKIKNSKIFTEISLISDIFEHNL